MNGIKMGDKMCSILKYKNCVGRNFDYEKSYNEEIRTINSMEYDNEFEIIGVCAGIVDYPLMYDGINEHGLVVGALAFEGNAQYFDEKKDKINIPAFDFVFQISSSFKTVKEVKDFLENVNITNKQFSEDFPNSDLHWFVADHTDSIIVEQTIEGLKVYHGDVMTNNPPYPDQIDICKQFFEHMEPLLIPKINKFYTRGVETAGLDGDYTSFGRFARLTYLKYHLEKTQDCEIFDPVAPTFHLLSSVEQIYGSTPVNNDFEYTIYSIVYDMDLCTIIVKPYDKIELDYYSF